MVTRKARHVKFRISPSCIHEMRPDIIFSKGNQLFQKERKKYYLQSPVICAMQALALHQIIPMQRQMTYS